MLYVKGKLENGDIINTPITNNVYNICPGCGVEVPISLNWFKEDEDVDFMTTVYYCDNCIDERLRSGQIELKATPVER